MEDQPLSEIELVQNEIITITDSMAELSTKILSWDLLTDLRERVALLSQNITLAAKHLRQEAA